MKLNFFDKNDPRIFLYKLPKHKWMGVTLNFAHVRAWKILYATLLPIPMIVGIIFALSLLLKPMNNTFDWRAWSMVGSSFVLIISYIVVISIYYFRMAAKDTYCSRTEKMNKIRCPWAGDTQIYIDHHDNEWGAAGT